MPPALYKNRFNCGHTRATWNRTNSGHSRYKCRTCKNEQRQRRNERTIGPLLKEQKGQCAICRRKLTKPNQDHNHRHKTCNRIGGGNGPSGCTKCRRGLLCGGCNGGLHMVENRKLLSAALKYLKEWKS